MKEKTKGAAAIKFGTPPPAREVRYDWPAIADKLRARPEEWALIFTGDRTTLVTALRAGSIRALRPRAGFEVRTANNTRGTPRTCDLWMRYVPAKNEESR